MNNRYWDKLGDQYSDEIINVHESDERGLLGSAIRKHLKRNQLAADFGCGIGWGISPLAERAKRVYGIDASGKLLAQARRRFSDQPNVEFVQADLCKAPPGVPPVQLGLCVNVLLTPNHEQRAAMLGSMARMIGRGGVLLLVTPSLESQMWVHACMVSQARAEGPEELKRAKRVIKKEAHSLAEGLINLEGSLTKYHLGPELESLLRQEGLETLSLQKIEYDWEAEAIAGMPAEAPRPWHWFVTAKRI